MILMTANGAISGEHGGWNSFPIQTPPTFVMSSPLCVAERYPDRRTSFVLKSMMMVLSNASLNHPRLRFGLLSFSLGLKVQGTHFKGGFHPHKLLLSLWWFIFYIPPNR